MAGVSDLVGVDRIFDGAGVQFAPLGFGFSGEWERLEVQEVSAVSTLDIIFDETKYYAIEVEMLSVQFGTDGDTLAVRTSSNSGSSFDSGASDYKWVTPGWRVPGTAFESEGDGDTELQLHTNGSNVSSEAFNGTFRVYDPGNSNTDTHVGAFLAPAIGNVGETSVQIMGGRRDAAGVVNAIQFRTSGSNTFSGIFIVRGLKKTLDTFTSQDDWVVIEDSVNPTAAATHDFFWDDNVWDEIEITINGAVIGTDTNDIFVRFSSDGSTFHSGATDYEYSFFNQNSSGTSSGAESNTGNSEFKVAFNCGTAADEDVDIVLHLPGVSNSAKKQRMFAKGTGFIENGTYHQWNSYGIDTNTNDRTRGIQIRGGAGATVTWDRLRIRGRRKTPIGTLKQDWELIEFKDIAESGSVAEIEFTDIPVAEYDYFELLITDLDCDTSANNGILQFSNDNGATWDTGNNYHFSFTRMSSETGNTTDRSSSAAHIQISVNFGNASDRLLHARYLLAGLNTGSRCHVFGHVASINDSGNYRTSIGGGHWQGTGSTSPGISAFRLDLLAGGNFTAGKLWLRGYRARP